MKGMFAAVLVAALIVAVAVVPAIALDDPVTARLYVGPAEGYYGQDCVLMPQTNVVPVPKERFEFQINNRGTWEKYDEQLVEETGTVDPMTIVLDDSIKFPAEFRVLFLKPSKDASGNAIFIERAVSETETVDISRYTASKALIAAPRSVRAGKAFRSAFSFRPYAGVGKIKVAVHRRSGARWVKVKSSTLTSDDLSEATKSFRFSRTGTYRITARFVGNSWAVASRSSSRIFVVK